MNPTISLYINRSQNRTDLNGGQLVGQFAIHKYTTLQTIGASIYEFARDNHIVNYDSYVITFSGSPKAFTGTMFPGRRGIEYQERVEMLLPNDIYRQSYAQLNINDLSRVLSRSSLGDNIRVDIEPEFTEGLYKQFHRGHVGTTYGNLVTYNQWDQMDQMDQMDRNQIGHPVPM